MRITHRLLIAGTAVTASPAAAQTMDVSVAIPRPSVAEYHKPYVGIWIEGPARQAKTLAVWYDVDNQRGEGEKWLVDVRQWWRASGRALDLPVNGVSGATRGPGAQKISFGPRQLGTLAPGQYTLLVEAAREVGGREVVRVPFAWPPKPGQTASAAGKAELGQVTASFRR
jgi:hypothetical protein